MLNEMYVFALSYKNIEAVPVVRGEGGQDRVHRQGKVGLCELKEKYYKRLPKKLKIYEQDEKR
jgi:hypothetical protein